MVWEIVERHRVPARTGVAVEVRQGRRVTIVDVDGGQVGDFFAFNRDDTSEYLSASHTRAYNSRIFPKPGQPFMSSRRRPMLQILKDTSPGYHDMLIAACDPPRYEQLGVEGWYPSCAENLVVALKKADREIAHIPQPFNVFMRTPATVEGAIVWLLAESKAGDRFEMEALQDLIVVLSSCPSELSGINAGELSDLELEISKKEEA